LYEIKETGWPAGINDKRFFFPWWEKNLFVHDTEKSAERVSTVLYG
jgi:hypothetical protein